MAVLKAMVVLLVLVSEVFANGNSAVSGPQNKLDTCQHHCQSVMNLCISSCRRYFL